MKIDNELNEDILIVEKSSAVAAKDALIVASKNLEKQNKQMSSEFTEFSEMLRDQLFSKLHSDEVKLFYEAIWHVKEFEILRPLAAFQKWEDVKVERNMLRQSLQPEVKVMDVEPAFSQLASIEVDKAASVPVKEESSEVKSVSEPAAEAPAEEGSEKVSDKIMCEACEIEFVPQQDDTLGFIIPFCGCCRENGRMDRHMQAVEVASKSPEMKKDKKDFNKLDPRTWSTARILRGARGLSFKNMLISKAEYDELRKQKEKEAALAAQVKDDTSGVVKNLEKAMDAVSGAASSSSGGKPSSNPVVQTRSMAKKQPAAASKSAKKEEDKQVRILNEFKNLNFPVTSWANVCSLTKFKSAVVLCKDMLFEPTFQNMGEFNEIVRATEKLLREVDAIIAPDSPARKAAHLEPIKYAFGREDEKKLKAAKVHRTERKEYNRNISLLQQQEALETEDNDGVEVPIVPTVPCDFPSLGVDFDNEAFVPRRTAPSNYKSDFAKLMKNQKFTVLHSEISVTGGCANAELIDEEEEEINRIMFFLKKYVGTQSAIVRQQLEIDKPCDIDGVDQTKLNKAWEKIERHLRKTRAGTKSAYMSELWRFRAWCEDKNISFLSNVPISQNDAYDYVAERRNLGNKVGESIPRSIMNSLAFWKKVLGLPVPIKKDIVSIEGLLADPDKSIMRKKTAWKPVELIRFERKAAKGDRVAACILLQVWGCTRTAHSQRSRLMVRESDDKALVFWCFQGKVGSLNDGGFRYRVPLISLSGVNWWKFIVADLKAADAQLGAYRDYLFADAKGNNYNVGKGK